MAPRMKIETSSDAAAPSPRQDAAQKQSQPQAAPKPKVTAAPKPTVAEAPKASAASAPKPKVTSTPPATPAPAVTPAPAADPAPKKDVRTAQHLKPRIADQIPEIPEVDDQAYAQTRDAETARDQQPYGQPQEQAYAQQAEQPQGHAEAQTNASAAGQAPKRSFGDVCRSISSWVHRTFPGHEHAFWGGVIALFVAVLVFIIGLPRMLLICVLVVIGVAVGQIADGDPKIIRAFTNLFNSDRDQT